MDDLLQECLESLETALQWLELPDDSRPSPCQIEKCRSSISAARAYLAAKAKKQTPLERLNLPTGIYNSLMRAGYQTVESVSCLAPWQLLAIPRIGRGYKDEIIKTLENWRREGLKTLCP